MEQPFFGKLMNHVTYQFPLRVPILLHQTMLPLIFQQLKIAPSITNGRRMRKWHDLAETSDRILDPVSIPLANHPDS